MKLNVVYLNILIYTFKSPTIIAYEGDRYIIVIINFKINKQGG